MQQAATDDTIVWPPWGDRLRRRENQCMLSSFVYGWKSYEGHYCRSFSML